MSNKKKPAHVMSNDINLAKGTFRGTWTGYRIRVGNVTEILTDITLQDINVAVTVEVTEDLIKIYVD